MNTRLGICILVKDTPDYLMKLWIEHHVKLGVSNIWCYVDINSKPIYQDKHVEYIYMTADMRRSFEFAGHKYAIYEDTGTHIQEGVYNDCLTKHRNDCDWLACIDDDEFLNIDFSIFDKYKDENCIYIPWKMMYTTDIKCQYNLNNYKCLVYSNLKNDSMFNNCLVKSILNTHNIQYCRSVHFGDLAGVFCTDDEQFRFLINRPISLYMKNVFITNFTDNLDINFIYHYKFRSFEEWLCAVCDRDDLGDDDPMYTRFNRTLKLWFDTLSDFGEYIDYSENSFNNIIKQLNREDIFETPFYDWGHPKTEYVCDNTCVVIFNMNKSTIENINNDAINKILNNIKESTGKEINKENIFIIDYLRYANRYNYTVIDRRNINHWWHNYNARLKDKYGGIADILQIFKIIINDIIHVDNKHKMYICFV